MVTASSNTSSRRLQRKHILLYAAVGASVFSQLTLCLLAMSETSSTSGKRWSVAEVDHLLDRLIDWRKTGKVGDGNNYPGAAWTAVVQYLGQKGFTRTKTQCTSKWDTLKSLHKAIYTWIESRSGAHWDNKRGANIVGEAARVAFESHIATKSGSKMKAFRNTGWEHWDKMELANPGQEAGGSHVFSPLIADAPQPEDLDIEETEADTPHAGYDPGVTPDLSNADDQMAVDASDTSTVATSAVATGSSAHLSTPPSTAPPTSQRGQKRLNDDGAMPPPAKKPASSSSRFSSQSGSASRPESSSTSTRPSNPSTCVIASSINNNMSSFIDAIKDGMLSDRTKATSAIQVQEEISVEDRRIMIRVFTQHISLAEIYLALNKDYRLDWVQSVLLDIRSKEAQGMTLNEAIQSLSSGV
ncbi:hypothetical protein HWV62_16920 [Athelia sp. TMB]|nr:hypothetical protein HWV62_16920 [Athelia sp. TMB]